MMIMTIIFIRSMATMMERGPCSNLWFEQNFRCSFKMNSALEGFLKVVKTRYAFKFPDYITRENVNVTSGGCTILDVAVNYGDANVVKILIGMGAIFYAIDTYRTCNDSCFEIILELGIDYRQVADLFHNVGLATSKRKVELLIDYGIRAPVLWHHNVVVEDVKRIERYTTLSNTRVQECKTCLLAKSYVCSISKFRALREILLCAVRQTWAMLGGKGCGPRAHGWIF